MARGFESKAVADQQEAAQGTPPPRDESLPAPAELAKKRRLELSRADVVRRLQAARVDAHRQMLERALRALDEEIAQLR
jgi:hypothetical protein